MRWSAKLFLSLVSFGMLSTLADVSQADELKQPPITGPCGPAQLAPVRQDLSTINQDFAPWIGKTSPDGVWRINGPWKGSGVILDPALAKLSSTYDGRSGGFLSLTVQANALRGSEI